MQYLIILLLLVCGLAFAQSNPGSLTSPDGGIQARFLTVRSNQPASNGQLVYAVAFKGKPLATGVSAAIGLERPAIAWVECPHCWLFVINN